MEIHLFKLQKYFVRYHNLCAKNFFCICLMSAPDCKHLFIGICSRIFRPLYKWRYIELRERASHLHQQRSINTFECMKWMATRAVLALLMILMRFRFLFTISLLAVFCKLPISHFPCHEQTIPFFFSVSFRKICILSSPGTLAWLFSH